MAKRKSGAGKKTLRIKSVEPTAKFVNEAGGLSHVVDVTIENTGSRADANLLVQGCGDEVRICMGSVPKGKTTVEAHFPDIRKETEIGVGLYVGDALQDQRQIDWKPTRHWHIYLVPTSHHDWGYTDLPSRVLELHDQFMDNILDYCDETDDFPEESKYRYSIEASWSLAHFLKNRDERQVQRCVQRIREGRIELTALFGNQTSEMCSHEELVRLLYPSFNLKRKYGFCVESAELQRPEGHGDFAAHGWV